jgi:ABC-2 type transport system permease protein
MQAAIDELEQSVETLEGSTAELLDVNRELLANLLEVHGHLRKAVSLMPPGMKPKVSLKEMEEREAEIESRIEETEEKRASLDRNRPAPSSPGPAETFSVTHTVATGGERDVNLSSVQVNVPGWTIFGLFWIVQILALSIIGERTSGAYHRILVAPVSYTSYLLGKALPYLGVNLVQAALMLGIGIWVLPLLDAPGLSIANPGAAILLTLAISICAISLGLFMASLTRSAIFVGSVSAVVLVIMTAMGGIMVPTFVMPDLMQKMSLLVPHGWALEGYLDAIVRGRSIVDVLPHAGALLGFACVFFVIAVLRMRSVDRSR